MNKRDCKFGAALCAAQLAAASSAMANNIQVSSVTLQSIDTTADTAMVQFNLSWENSWRVTTGPANFDAAWVFVKYHTGDQIWKTATLDISDAAHSVPAAATLDVGANGTRGMGAFVYRAAPGSGNVNYSGIRLKWNYGVDGVSDAALITLDVHAIEMVYIPSGAFQVGDGGARAATAPATAADVGTLSNGTTAAPFTITSSGPIPVGVAAGNLGATGLAAGTYKPVPTTFPDGFDAFYIMKYEGSQGEWAAFYNTTVKFPAIAFPYYEIILPQVPAAVPPRDMINGRQIFFSVDQYTPPTSVPPPTAAVPAPPVPTRPIVQAKTPDRAFTAATTPAAGEENAALAYLDWAGLRPMTEFEYEKAARGPVAPVTGEFAWGTSDVALVTYSAPTEGTGTLGNDGLPAEAPGANYNELGGNAWTRATVLLLPGGGPILGPARVGMFAKATYNPPTPPRIQSGAGYYGVMDLTGNVSEVVARWTFPLTSSTATLFTAENGDGLLNPATGQQNVAGWTSAATYFALRGGSFAEAPVPVSVRSVIGATATMNDPGIRGVRSAPVTGP